MTAGVAVPTGPRYLRLREEVLEYLWQEFPSHCIMMTDPQTRRVIDLAAGRAAAHGFTAAGQVCSWITMMVFCGAFFDEDPLCPWASETLRATSGQSRDDALRSLFEAMNTALDPVVGQTGEHYRRALLWAMALRFDTIAADSEGSPDQAVERWLRTGFPEKHASLTREQMSLLASEAQARALQFGLAVRPGAILCALLMALLGIHIDRDPLYAWVGDVLRDDSVLDPMAKTKRLHDRAIAMLRRHLVVERYSQPE